MVLHRRGHFLHSAVVCVDDDWHAHMEPMHHHVAQTASATVPGEQGVYGKFGEEGLCDSYKRLTNFYYNSFVSLTDKEWVDQKRIVYYMAQFFKFL